MGVPTNIPVGVDWADGSTLIPPTIFGSSTGISSLIGTPSPAEDLVTMAPYDSDGSNMQLNEVDGSPELERAEQCTVSHTQIMPEWQARSFSTVLGRGTLVNDSYGNAFRILSSRYRRLGSRVPGFSEFTHVEESISFDTPPDDFSIRRVELGATIIKNPRYFSNLYPTTNNVRFGINDFTTLVGSAKAVATVAQVKMGVIRAIQSYQDAPFFPSSNTANGLVQNSIIQIFLSGIIPIQVNGSTVNVTITGGSPQGIAACQLAIAAAGEIIQNLWYQDDVPLVPVFEMRWSQYWFFTPYNDPGCYIQDPRLFIPDYFVNPETTQQSIPNTGDGNENPNPNITPSCFDQFIKKNPQYFSDDGTVNGNLVFSALRLPDEVEFQRTWFRQDHLWYVACVGHWNPLIFQQGPRPSKPSDYLPLQ